MTDSDPPFFSSSFFFFVFFFTFSCVTECLCLNVLCVCVCVCVYAFGGCGYTIAAGPEKIQFFFPRWLMVTARSLTWTAQTYVQVLQYNINPPYSYSRSFPLSRSSLSIIIPFPRAVAWLRKHKVYEAKRAPPESSINDRKEEYKFVGHDSTPATQRGSRAVFWH